MSVVLHQDSTRGVAMDAVGMGAVPTTQDTVAMGGNQLYDIFPCREPIANLTAGQPITFLSTKSTMCTDLNGSFIQFKGVTTSAKKNTLSGDFGDVAHGNSLAPEPMFAANLLRDIEVQINGTVVKPSQGSVDPYATGINVALEENFLDRETNNAIEGCILDDIENGGSNDPDTNFGVYTRKFLYSNCGTSYTENGTTRYKSSPFSLAIRPATWGLKLAGWLPPNTDIRISARFEQSNFIYRTEAAENEANDVVGSPTEGVTSLDPKFLVFNADLYLARKELTPHAHAALMAGWVQRPITLAYRAVRTNVSYFQANTTSINIVGALGGVTPRCVVALFLEQESINGARDNRTWETQPTAAFQNVRLTVGGSRFYPLQAITVDKSERADPTQVDNPLGTMDYALLYNLYREVADKRQPFLRSADFANIMPICFPIGSQLDAWDAGEDMTVQFQAQLSQASAVDYAIMLLSLTDSFLEIESTGRVQVGV